MKAFENPNHEGNSSRHHTGKPCWMPNCDRPAGTAWSLLFCFKCNRRRMRKIDRQIQGILDSWPKKKEIEHE